MYNTKFSSSVTTLSPFPFDTSPLVTKLSHIFIGNPTRQNLTHLLIPSTSVIELSSFPQQKRSGGLYVTNLSVLSYLYNILNTVWHKKQSQRENKDDSIVIRTEHRIPNSSFYNHKYHMVTFYTNYGSQRHYM